MERWTSKCPKLIQIALHFLRCSPKIPSFDHPVVWPWHVWTLAAGPHGFPLDPGDPRAISEAENTPGANACAGNFIRLNCLVSCLGSQAGRQPFFGGVIRESSANDIRWPYLTVQWIIMEWFVICNFIRILYPLAICSFPIFGHFSQFQSLELRLDHGYPIHLPSGFYFFGAQMSSIFECNQIHAV